MEQQKPKKKLRWLVTLLCILAAIALLCGTVALTISMRRSCKAANAPAAKATASPSPEPTAIPDRAYETGVDAPAFAPDLTKLGMSELEIDEYGAEYLAQEYWLDITPDGAEGFAVIRHVGTGYSYVVQDDAYYRLGEGVDGKGALDVLLCDLDYNGTPDLLYTYNFGSNEDVCSKVGWFDLDTHASVLSAFALPNGYLGLAKEQGVYLLYRATRTTDGNNGFALHFETPIGELMESGGDLFLNLY